MPQNIEHHKINGLNDLLTVEAVDEPTNGAFHVYRVRENWDNQKPKSSPFGPPTFANIKFQRGPIGETGVNGASNESLLAVVLHRLECFQSTLYACQENADAISMITGALTCLKARTERRIEQGIEGTSAIDPAMATPELSDALTRGSSTTSVRSITVDEFNMLDVGGELVDAGPFIVQDETGMEICRSSDGVQPCRDAVKAYEDLLDEQAAESAEQERSPDDERRQKGGGLEQPEAENQEPL